MNQFAALIGAIVVASEPPAVPGAVLPYDEALKAAPAQGLPLVTFYGVEARPVSGLVPAMVPEGRKLPGVAKPSVVVCTFGKGVRASYAWPHDVTDTEIQAKAVELAASVASTRIVRETPETLPPDVLRQLRPSLQNCKPKG